MEKHNIDPVYDSNSKILILGSFPSVKSREQKFFYGHPQNRFWRVLSKVLNEVEPNTVDEKKRMLLRNNIAVWDVVKSCEISGSSDNTIENVEVNDIDSILEKSKIFQIFTNGNTAYKLFKKYFPKELAVIKLPSTSPANAQYNLEKLCNSWQKISCFLNKNS